MPLLVWANPPLLIVAVTPLDRAMLLLRFRLVTAKRVVALEATVSVPVPKALLLPKASVPALILVPPEYVLLNASVVVPDPDCVRVPLPARTSPIKAAPVLVAVMLVTVSVPLPVMDPLPNVTAPTVVLKALLVSVPACTLSVALVAPRAKELLTTKVPAVRMVPPL